SKRARISPASARETASGFARIRVRSTAMRPPTLAGRASRALRLRPERHRLLRHDRRLAVRADLPGRVERAVAGGARLAELRRADRADEVVRPDRRAAHGAVLLVLAEAPLDRLDLELALVDVGEVLRRPEQHVDERAEERRDRADERREPDEDRLGDA